MQRIHLPVWMAGAMGAWLALLCALGPGAAGAEAVRKQIREGKPRSARIDYALPEPTLEIRESPDGQRFTEVKVFEGGRSAEVGQPDLPILVDDIAVARRGEISVRVSARGQRQLSTPHWIYPVQESVPKVPGALERRRFRLDDVWYRTPNRRNAATAGVPFSTTTYTVRGQRYVRVQAAPYAFDPVGKVLTYPATVSLEVTVADPALPAAAGPRSGLVQILRVRLGSRAELDDLQARGADIKTIQAGAATVYATAAERTALEQAGYGVEWIGEQSSTATAPAKSISAGYHDWGQVQALLSQFASTYPTLCRLETIGSSGGGRPILALRITDHPDTEEAEPEVRFVGAIHGDEVIGTEMSLLFIDYLLSGYASDSRLAALVDNTDIWMVPVMNPDGYAANTRYTTGGIDLNRSFPDGAETTIGTVFGGTAMDTDGRPAETIAMMEWSAAHHFALSATFHTGALVANYPYDNDGLGSVFSPTPDEDVFVWLAETYATHNSPMWNSTEFTHGITNGAAWYEVIGGMQDWLYRYTGCLELTLEISTSDRPVASALSGLWNDNREAMLAYLEASQAGLRGVVTETATGLPLYASIAIQGRTPQVYTDPAVGDYYRLLRPGTYTVVVSAPGYQPQVLADIVVGSGAATRLDVALEKTDSTGGAPLIAVHHADHDVAYAAYREQKQSEGYAVTEVRLTGTPTAENVRAQIRSAYDATAARFVVILGDIETVPTFTHSAYGTTARSDLAYALLDPDETFASYLGKDVGLGRISLDSNAELLEYVAKLGVFDRGPRNDDLTWVSGGSATWESDMAEDTHTYVMANYIDATRYHNELFYRDDGSAAELSAHIDAGTDLVVYSGHGSETGWLRYDYDGGDLAGLTNTLDVPIVIGHCCLTGSFLLDDCFAEQWLATKERAVAYVGGSQNTLWDEDDTLQRREFQWLYEHPGGTLSEALDWGLRQTAAAYPATAEYYFTIYHVFGDPTVRVFGLPLEITHAPLTDTAQRAADYVVDATVAAPVAVTAVLLYWRASPAAVFSAVPMSAMGDTAYRATIPGQPYGTQVQYYLQATDANSASASHPANAPAAWHSFRVDVLFAHTPQGNTTATAPTVIQAAVAADGPLTATLHWASADGAYTAVPLSAGAGGLLSGSIPGQPSGTTVSYYLTATMADGYGAASPEGAPGAVYQFLVDTDPPVFAGLDLASAGDHSVALSWSAAVDPSGPVTYSIYRAAASGAQDFGGALATTQGLTYDDATASNGTAYFYVVRARDALGNAEANVLERAATPRGREVVFSWSLDSDPGWSYEGGWSFGPPGGFGGLSHGNPDPTAGATGSSVLGFNALGDYSNGMAVEYLTTAPMDCSASGSTELRFQRWLNVEQPNYDHATVEVSCNGADWGVVWENGAEVADDAWTAQVLDISAYADGCATFRVRWGMGPTDGSWTYSGWNLDDVQIWGISTTPVEYLLSVSCAPAAGGSVVADPPPDTTGRYPAETRVSLSAVAAAGFAFAGWSGAATGAASPVEVVLGADLAVTATFAELDTTAPEFAGLTGATGGDGQVTLAWDAGWDASLPITYEVYRAETSAGQTFAAPVGTTQALTYVDTDVSNGTTYYYVVQALDAAGNRAANTVEMAAMAGAFGCVYAWPLATDPGWTRDSAWAFGVPRGAGGRSAGFPDPRQGSTGTTVFGYNLQGDYRNNLRPRCLTTAAIDCSRLVGTQLRYQRWLNVEGLPQDRAAVEVSRDGSVWQTVWQNDATVEDAAWQPEAIDISAYADGCAALQLRWVMGPTSRRVTMSGWNLDDVEIWGTVRSGRSLTLSAVKPSAKGLDRRARTVDATGWTWPLFCTGASTDCITFGVAPEAQQVVANRTETSPGAWLMDADRACTTLLLENTVEAASWRLEVVPASGADAVLSWVEPGGVPGELLVTLVEVDGEGDVIPGGLGLDLRRAVELTVPAGATRHFALRAAPETTSEWALEAGWNALALPISPALPAPAAVFPDLIGAATTAPAVLVHDRARGGYVPATTIEALQGVWVHSSAPMRLLVTGVALSEPTLRLAAGWNLVGVPTALAECPGLDQGVGPWLEVRSAGATLRPVGELEPGQAYWVFSVTAVTLAVGDHQ